MNLKAGTGEYNVLSISKPSPLFLMSSFCCKELTNVVVAILTDHWSACQTLLSEIKLT